MPVKQVVNQILAKAPTPIEGFDESRAGAVYSR